MSLRRFSFAPLLFVALWGFWFLLPTTREAARSQWKARFVSSTPAPPSGNSRDEEFVRALDATNSPQDANRTKALDQLSRKRPDDAAICAARIVMGWNDLHLGTNRQAGPSSNASPNWSVMLTKVETPTPEALKSWFEAANRGAALEPNNTFWDWAKLMGLLAANRNDEVWPVLRAASLKTGYDDHTSEGALARVRLAKQKGLVSPISQISISASVLFPHYAKMREAARQLSDNASGLRLTNQPQKQTLALEGMRDFVLLSRTMRRESKPYIGSLVGQAMEAIGLWGGSYSPTRPKGGKRPPAGSKLYTSDPRSLVFFARQIGRADIASQMNRDWNELGAWRTKTRGAVNTLFMGINLRDFVVAQAGDWFGSLLLMAIPWLLVVAIVSSILLRLIPAWRRESAVSPSRASWAWGAVLSVAALFALSSPALWTLWSAWRKTGSTPTDLLFESIYGEPSGAGMVPPVWQTFFPALLGIVAALHLAALWNARREGKPSLTTRLRRILHAPDDRMASFDLSPILSLVGAFATIFILTAGVFGFLILLAVNDDFHSLQEYAGLVLLGFGVVLVLPMLVRLRSAPAGAFALILVRRFAWGQLVFVTILWGLLWMLAAPAQTRFDADFMRQMQVGEFQIARKQLGI